MSVHVKCFQLQLEDFTKPSIFFLLLFLSSFILLCLLVSCAHTWFVAHISVSWPFTLNAFLKLNVPLYCCNICCSAFLNMAFYLYLKAFSAWQFLWLNSHDGQPILCKLIRIRGQQYLGGEGSFSVTLPHCITVFFFHSG